MSSVSALFGAATRLASAGRRGELARSVCVDGGAEGLPAETTMLIGGDDPGLAEDPVLAGWFARMVGAVTGRAPLDLSAPGRLGGAPVWPILAEGGGHFDASALVNAIPRGTAWLVATRPERFFAQAASRLEARGDARGADWAARLRSPSGNLALLGRIVRTVGITLQVGDPGASTLRLRVTCPDDNAARQAVFALHGWRERRGLGDGLDAAVFRASDLLREGRRVELVLPGELDTLIRLFGIR
ncbi:MAG: hypothetical protein Q8P41_22480 [Pseudomonadota bacterium]|nr:hypothetical protein [Pseudomonadota bacterium]